MTAFHPPLGAHMSIAGGHDKAVLAAHRLGFETVQVFTKSTNQWAAKPLTGQDATAFREAIQTTGLVHPVAHNSYLINLASPDEALWQKSIDAMVVEVERAEALGIPDLVTHPGAHMGAGEEAGLDRVAAAIDRIHERTAGVSVTIDLENTAGQGTCLGHRIEHLAGVLARVAAPARLGVCLDTCHLYAAGYAFEDPGQYNAFLVELGRILGRERVRVWHLNDSVRERGSRVDRHAGIGRGRMGLDPFRRIVTDPGFATVPMILETPKGIEDGQELDALNLAILRGFRDRPRRPRRTRASKGMGDFDGA